jgi:hypothetical protein
MSAVPRRHPRTEAGRPRPAPDLPLPEEHPDGAWYVRRLTGIAVVKAYRCPGCQQEIPVGQPHTVAWRADSDGEDRRHWHNGCWAARLHRHPPGRSR